VIVVFLGPPGSGKGTQAARLAQRAKIPQISTGDMLRQAVADGTELGRKARAIMDAGELVSDDIIVAMIEARISAPDCRDGFILDGFPRTAAQAEALERMLASRGLKVDAVLNLQVDEDELAQRMAGRARQEGRSDDNPETIRERLRVYREKTAPLVDWYSKKDTISSIDGMGSIEEISGGIDRALAREGAAA